jgi:hypothetical protein
MTPRLTSPIVAAFAALVVSFPFWFWLAGAGGQQNLPWVVYMVVAGAVAGYLLRPRAGEETYVIPRVALFALVSSFVAAAISVTPAVLFWIADGVELSAADAIGLILSVLFSTLFLLILGVVIGAIWYVLAVRLTQGTRCS